MTRSPPFLLLIAAMLPLVATPASARPRHHHAVHRRAAIHHRVAGLSPRPQHGVASFYGREEAGRKTASGKRMSPARMTAASNTLPLGTKAEVINKDTGRTAEVTINDRGPHKPGRIIDVTPKAAQALGIKKEDGVADVVVKPVAPPPDPK